MDRQRLHDMYNATSTDDGKGGIQSYRDWLEEQLISRIVEIRSFQLKELEARLKLLEKDNGKIVGSGLVTKNSVICKFSNGELYDITLRSLGRIEGEIKWG